MKFTEEKLEKAIIPLLGEQGYPHYRGGSFDRQLGRGRIASPVCL
jgi:type I restriction enzyme R subunit